MDETLDTESVNGNIFNALLTFPVVHTFHGIGKTNGNTTIVNEFTQQVQDVITSITGIDDTSTDDNNYSCTVSPRGTKFTKITIECQVYNANMITTIYDKLKNDIELSVTQF
jgi:putative lipoic acid-binding regulatory protein